MRWEVDAEQKMFVEALADWLGDTAAPEQVRAALESADPAAFEHSLAEAGWLGVGLAEEQGGQGGGLLELALIAEQLAMRAAPSSAWLATVLALPALDPATAADVVENGRSTALAVAADSAAFASAFTATEAGISGTVRTVLGADRATLLVVPAGGSLYLVEVGASGVSIEPGELLDRSRSTGDITLADAAGTKLDADADAFLADARLRAAVLVAADALGAATRMLALSVEYSRQRTQFGAAIGSFQAMKHAAATMLVAEEASRSIVYYAAASVDDGLPESSLHAATAKAQATATASRSAESALTMHGAIGYTWEHDLQLLYKRAKLDHELFGSPAVWNERIADELGLLPVP
ncbi:acyl-CoA dehydrogenase [Subtercola boreus]|uniref:Acyl-CoA dehydrogenase n=1 Tax=Subtercola boreus TaxID=120213 RepID=A0A3E0VNN5_9MICO|nr:acyl-CoA dehydrogenase family protein [Subtercola boreus]RFA10497.1 acyl-CoA dehydrogenase [Subtercola boreus]TQL55966.1 alkylation response protein AidB-like acyl-CoA dehydrogenase [Subtercola boreus]